MTTRVWTLIVMATVLVGVVVYDSFMATNKIPGDTISEITVNWAFAHPISVLCLGMALGILFGHLFWFQTVSK